MARAQRGQKEGADEEDYLVERVRKQRLQPYDKLLKAFNYGAALDAALATGQAQVCTLPRRLACKLAACDLACSRRRVRARPRGSVHSIA